MSRRRQGPALRHRVQSCDLYCDSEPPLVVLGLLKPLHAPNLQISVGQLPSCPHQLVQYHEPMLFNSLARTATVASAPRPLLPALRLGRAFSTSLSSLAVQPSFDASQTKVTTTTSPKPLPNPDSLKFGKEFTDHMISINWNSDKGWGAPEIKPYGPLVLDPSSIIFHYAPSLFEGMKAYKDAEGHIRLFRPDKNMARLQKSAARLSLPVR